MTNDAWILDAVRTPIGRHRGALCTVRPDDLAATVLARVVERAGVEPSTIDDVYLGCANGAGEDNRNVARMAALLAGLGHDTPGATINRLCASGLEAVASAARTIRCSEGELLVAGGVESMTRAPWVMLKPGFPGFPRSDAELKDTTIGWRFVNPRMPASATDSMGQTAENVARAYRITRADQDRFALESHRRALAARAAGRFADEIVALEVSCRREESLLVEHDEGPRTDTTFERLAELRPAFARDGTVTAGNSSSIDDGAAALLLGGDAALARWGRQPLARVVSVGVAGVDPALMGVGPVPATRIALGRAGLSVGDLAVVELNEAFASQAVACIRQLDLDPAIVNPNGGAIALGHPLGMSGARIVATLAWELRRRGARYGLATMCVGVGQGVAMVIENPGGSR